MANVIVNGNFATAANWGKSDRVRITGGQCIFENGGRDGIISIDQTVSLKGGKTYYVTHSHHTSKRSRVY